MIFLCHLASPPQLSWQSMRFVSVWSWVRSPQGAHVSHCWQFASAAFASAFAFGSEAKEQRPWSSKLAHAGRRLDPGGDRPSRHQPSAGPRTSRAHGAAEDRKKKEARRKCKQPGKDPGTIKNAWLFSRPPTLVSLLKAIPSVPFFFAPRCFLARPRLRF